MSDTTRQHHLSKVTLAPQCSYVEIARHPKHRSQYLDSFETEYNAFFCSSLMYYQSAVLDVSSYMARFPSTRVRIPGTLGGDNVEHQLTINSATDIPCIAQTFIRNHATLRHNRVLPTPPGAISLRSADGTNPKIWDIFVSPLSPVINFGSESFSITSSRARRNANRQ